MEEKKTIFDYLFQIMAVFGFSMLLMNIFCLVFGNFAEGFSALFELGNQGVPAKIAFEFLCLSALITGIRFLFFTDICIKEMPLWTRTLCMLVLVVMVIAVFIMIFGWFPVNMWQPWVMFFICFGISFLVSCLVMMIKEKIENRKMQGALEYWKEKEYNQNK